MATRYLPKELELEGVDALALIDVVTGVGYVTRAFRNLPDRVMIDMLATLERGLHQDNAITPPISKFVIGVTAQLAVEPDSMEKIKASLRERMPPG